MATNNSKSNRKPKAQYKELTPDQESLNKLLDSILAPIVVSGALPAENLSKTEQYEQKQHETQQKQTKMDEFHQKVSLIKSFIHYIQMTDKWIYLLPLENSQRPEPISADCANTLAIQFANYFTNGYRIPPAGRT